MTASNKETGPWPMRAFTRPSVVRDWLHEADLKPNRLLGQNFLIDGNILDILLDAAGVCQEDRVLEVGPGLGALTAGILERGAQLVTIEKDARFIPLLAAHLPESERLKIIQDDALDVAPTLLQEESINKFLSNLPYTPGTRILVDVVTSQYRPEQIAVMVQDEVAGRMAAEPGTPAFGLLSLWCRMYYKVRYIKRVSPNCFWPRPQVQSAIVHMQRLPHPLIPDQGWPFFQRLTRHLFQHRRKQMGNMLAKLHTGLPEPMQTAASFLPETYRALRPEALPLDLWCSLSENIRMKCEKQIQSELGETGDDFGR